MEIKKVNLDRTKLTTSHIEQKQDFNTVLNGVKLTRIPTWKSPWFYGAVGLSTVAISAISLSGFNIENQEHEKKATLKKENIQIAGIIPIKRSVEPKKVNRIKGGPSEKKKVNSSLKKKTESGTIPVPATKNLLSVNENDAVEKEVTIAKNLSGLPSLNGVSSGRMDIQTFQLSEGIESNANCNIVSFRIQYYNGREDIVAQISGNKIPQSIVNEIINFNVGQMIFFTDLKAVDEKGKLKLLPSMNILLTD